MANQKKGGVTPGVTIDDIFGNKDDVRMVHDKINWMPLTPEAKINEICADANIDENAKAAIRILIHEELKKYIDDISKYVINKYEQRHVGQDYAQRFLYGPIDPNPINPLNPWNQNPINPMNEFPQPVPPFQLQKPKQYALERLETLARELYYNMGGFDEAAIVHNCIAEIIKCEEDKR